MIEQAVKERINRLNKEATPVLQPLAYRDDSPRPRDAMGKVAFDVVGSNYLADFPAAPTTGVTAGIPDGMIMIELEKLGNDLNYTMSSVAKALEVPVTGIVLRVYANPVLMSFYKTIRRARAHLVKEERDRLSIKLMELADEDKMSLAIFKAYSLRIQQLDRDIRVMDREIFGGAVPAAQRARSKTGTIIEAEGTELPIISTSLDDHAETTAN